MKVVFEHQGRKTTILGNNYVTIVDKIRLLFPDQNHLRIQFYDPELSDYFEFTSYEQVIDQPNGLKMSFDVSSTSDSPVPDPSPPSTINDNQDNRKNTNFIKSTPKRSRKKPLIEPDHENYEPPSLPMYCNAIVQGLQSRESFPAIQQEFLRQTCAHFIQQYPDCISRKIHHSFVLALTQKFPSLNYLNKNVDGIDGRAPNHTISRLISRKKRNIKYTKNHPTPKRSRLCTLDTSSNEKTNENIAIEDTTAEDTTVEEKAHNLVVEYNKSLCNKSSIEQLLNESNVNETLASLPDPCEKSTATVPPAKTPTRPSTISNNIRRATISLVTPSTESSLSAASTSSSINTPFILTKPTMIKPITTTNAPTNIIYHSGRIHVNSFPLQSVVSVHKAIIPRGCQKQQEKKENNNCTRTEISRTTDPQKNILIGKLYIFFHIIFIYILESTIDNVNQSCITKNNSEIWYPKMSSSEKSAYEKDVARLRSIIKPKNKSTNNCSISEIHALIRSTHKHRRQMLFEKNNNDFYIKALQFQEIFHEDALIIEYMLLKDKIFSFEEMQHETRKVLDDFISKYKIEKQEKISETDFLIVKMLCEESGQHNLIFKNGLSNPHPMIGVLITSSLTNEFERAFLFVRNIPYKMSLSITNAGLHKVLSILMMIYINLNALPDHTVLRTLLEQCNKMKP
ncbi:unnamed protein product [Rotaria sp. Silwood1]|nr:unnamed protein product [Rotaria sp. Silwood1]CAF3732896.1 unnamed protein product [Rotaria sp. Silwood1]CAF4912422.1 unnamed protein product [Rotaria sp. Silwood1]